MRRRCEEGWEVEGINGDGDGEVRRGGIVVAVGRRGIAGEGRPAAAATAQGACRCIVKEDRIGAEKERQRTVDARARELEKKKKKK